MQTVKFSINGKGLFLKKFKEDSHLWEILKFYSESELNRSIFEHDLFSKFGFKNNEGGNISSYHDLIPDENTACYCTDRFTVLEIKIEGKRYGRIGFYDLVRSDLLFIAFPISRSEFKIEGLNIVESDIGNFGTAVLKVANFDVQLLQFELLKIENKNYINKIIYNDIVLEFKRANTLNQANYVLKQK